MSNEAKTSKKLINMLSLFVMDEIQSKALDGITYTMVMKDQKDKAKFEKFMEIREETQKCGFDTNQVFRTYEVSNGYIFDMDLSVTKYVTEEITKIVAKENQGKTPVGDLIGNLPQKRRKEDMVLISKFVLNQVKEGATKAEVALFSRNSVPRITINGRDEKGKPVLLKYNAYAIRHWDIEEINHSLLVPKGCRISKIEPCEILPSKTGVRFIIHFEKVK